MVYSWNQQIEKNKHFHNVQTGYIDTIQIDTDVLI